MAMSDYVAWMLELNIREGELENLKALIQEMVESTRANEPGTSGNATRIPPPRWLT